MTCVDELVQPPYFYFLDPPLPDTNNGRWRVRLSRMNMEETSGRSAVGQAEVAAIDDEGCRRPASSRAEVVVDV